VIGEPIPGQQPSENIIDTISSYGSPWRKVRIIFSQERLPCPVMVRGWIDPSRRRRVDQSGRQRVSIIWTVEAGVQVFRRQAGIDEGAMKKNLLWLLALLSLMGGYAFAQDSSEAAKIRYLIGSVETLQGVTFLRNGVEYDARKAADHLRLKLRMAEDRVKTAEDFIRLCGSKSSLSGEAYRMRFPDGTTLVAEMFFRERLKALVADMSSRP
jgi:hypothetical protein